MSDKFVEFMESIAVVCKDEFELEELKEAVQAERRKGSFKPAYILLEELRAKWATKH